jgi:hypothetical protein
LRPDAEPITTYSGCVMNRRTSGRFSASRSMGGLKLTGEGGCCIVLCKGKAEISDSGK